MPVFIYESDAKERIASVEGERWLVDQARFGSYGFEAFLAAWRTFLDYAREQRLDPSSERDRALYRELLDVDGNGAIYGVGGYHRYLVRYSGEILFSRHHSTSAGIEKATAAGFELA